MVADALLLIVLLALSAFFSGAEIALFSLGPARVRTLREEGRRSARAVERLKANPERLLATILVGNNLVNIGAASQATVLALEAYGSAGIAYATGVMTLLVLVFGEITPKAFAAANAERFSLAVAPFIYFLSRVLFPIVAPLERLTNWLVRRSERDGRLTVTEGEIREMTAIGHREGAIDEHERRIIERAFHLDTTRAWEIMTPRVDIFAWSAEQTLATIRAELPTVRFSRVPVYRSNVDEIVGILYLRDAYQALVSGRSDATLGELAREPFFVPGSIPLTRLLSDFQTQRIHMGVVIDEYGGTDGLVTLEDILEELVGEIEDETDVERQSLVRLSSNELLVEGNADLREVNQFFQTVFPLLEHRSLNGYLLDELGYVPRAGEEVERQGIVIRIIDSTETQVLQAILTRTETGEPGGEAAADDVSADASTRPEAAGPDEASGEPERT